MDTEVPEHTSPRQNESGLNLDKDKSEIPELDLIDQTGFTPPRRFPDYADLNELRILLRVTPVDLESYETVSYTTDQIRELIWSNTNVDPISAWAQVVKARRSIADSICHLGMTLPVS